MIFRPDFSGFFVFIFLFLTPNISHTEPVSLASSKGINLNEKKPDALAKLRDACKEVEASYNELEYRGKNCGDDTIEIEIDIKLKKKIFSKPTTKQVTETLFLPPDRATLQTTDRIFWFSDELIELFILKQQMREIKINPHNKVLNEEKNVVDYWCRDEMGYDPEQLNLWRKNQCTMISGSAIGNPCNMEAQNMGVSVPTKVLRPRPSSSSSFE